MKDKIKKILKTVPMVKKIKITATVLLHPKSLIKRFRALQSFFSDYRRYRKINDNPYFSLKTKDLYPRLYDDTAGTPVDPVYFYQNCWCAKNIFENKPARHFDIGSSSQLVGIISQFVPTTMIDIRPLPVHLKELDFLEGSILQLPFKDNEIRSLSSICVIEHIGLGRYGDPLDPRGSEKSAKELVRVLSPNGFLYVSVPIDSQNIIYFNAHRAFTRHYVLEMFKGLVLHEEKYIYGNNQYEHYDPQRGFGTGLYCFQKKKI